jgi:hypothetical protein
MKKKQIYISFIITTIFLVLLSFLNFRLSSFDFSDSVNLSFSNDHLSSFPSGAYCKSSIAGNQLGKINRAKKYLLKSVSDLQSNRPKKVKELEQKIKSILRKPMQEENPLNNTRRFK